jgi:hypothetical protein
MTEHLGHERNGRPGNESGNVRNGTRQKAVLTESTGQVQVDVPRDRHGTFEPQIVRKRQRRLSGVDEIVLSLYAIPLACPGQARPGRPGQFSRAGRCGAVPPARAFRHRGCGAP